MMVQFFHVSLPTNSADIQKELATIQQSTAKLWERSVPSSQFFINKYMATPTVGPIMNNPNGRHSMAQERSLINQNKM